MDEDEGEEDEGEEDEGEEEEGEEEEGEEEEGEEEEGEEDEEEEDTALESALDGLDSDEDEVSRRASRRVFAPSLAHATARSPLPLTASTG